MERKSLFLSRNEKQQGQKNYLKYTFINGLSYSFMAETIIYLLAMHFGANNLQLGYISSAVYLTGLAVFFVPIIFPNIKIIKLFFIAWLLRGVISLFYGITPFIPDNVAVYVIIIVYTVYCLLRNIAYPLNHVIQGYITKTSERGIYTSKVILFLYSSMTISRFISFSTLSIMGNNELYGVLLLILFGIILNTMASFSITKVPVKARIEKRSFKQAIFVFKYYLKQQQPLLLILIYCGGMSLFVLFNFSIPFLKKEVTIPSNIIFIYTTINFLGVILASKILRPFLDKFGSKPLLIIVNFIIIGLSVLWSMGSNNTPLYLLFILGFISMFFIGMIRILLERLIVNSIPEGDRIGFTSALAVVFSIISLGVGLGGGFLAEITITKSLNTINEYSLSFILMGFVALINIIVSIFIKERDSLSVIKVLLSLINHRNVKTLRNIDQLKRTNNHLIKKHILIELESDETELATEEIKKRLKLSTLRDKEMVIRSLFSNPRLELEDELIEEAQDKYSWWRQSAVFALGAYKTEKTRKTLKKIFKEKYPYLKSIAAKSLARIGDSSCLEEINDLLNKSSLDVRTYLNLIIAVSLIEVNGSYWKHIFRLTSDCSSHRFIQSLFVVGCTRMNFDPPIENFFHELNLDLRNGFETVFEELIDLKLTEYDFELLQTAVSEQDYYKVWAWCRSRAKSYKLVEPFEHIRLEIKNYKKRNIEASVALAGLYLTMQLELRHKVQLKNTNGTVKPE